MEIVGIIGLLIGIFGCIPVLLDYDLYIEKLKYCLSKDDLECEALQVTFDIISQEETRVYQTGKYRIKKNGAKLILEHCSLFGENKELRTRIDNVLLKNKFVPIDDKTKRLTYDIIDKSIGETIIVEDEMVFTVSKNDIRNYDGNFMTISPYKHKYLFMNMIFPKNYIPNSLTFTESTDKNSKKKIKMKHNTINYLACYANNRKQIQWTVKYPKFNHTYGINWYWKPL